MELSLNLGVMSNQEYETFQQQVEVLKQQLSTSGIQLQLDVGRQLLEMGARLQQVIERQLPEMVRVLNENASAMQRFQTAIAGACADSYTPMKEIFDFQVVVRELSQLSGLSGDEVRVKFCEYCEQSPLSWRSCFQEIKIKQIYTQWGGYWNRQCKFYSGISGLPCAVRPCGGCADCPDFEVDG